MEKLGYDTHTIASYIYENYNVHDLLQFNDITEVDEDENGAIEYGSTGKFYVRN